MGRPKGESQRTLVKKGMTWYIDMWKREVYMFKNQPYY